MRNIGILLFLLALGSAPLMIVASAGQWRVGDEIYPPSKPPSRGFVPDEQTAIAIAHAVTAPLYRKEVLQEQEPLHATLYRDTWIVKGQLPSGSMGAVLFVRMSKKDGRIITVTTR